MRQASVALMSTSLGRRAVTAFTLGPIVIAAVLLLPTSAFGLFIAAVLLGAAWEWCALSGIDPPGQRIAYLAVVAGTLALLWALPAWQIPLMALSVLWWLVQTVNILLVRQIEPVSRPQPLQLLAGLLVLAAPWAALVSLHRLSELGPWLVLALLVLIWSADSLAFFAGRRWGRAKLAPAVSPGKTRVGVYAGMLGALLCGLALSWALSLGLVPTLITLFVCGVAALVSVVGDLYESLLKRRRAMKDSSQLLPGHGGLLDRIDSLTAAAPLFALGMAWAIN